MSNKYITLLYLVVISALSCSPIKAGPPSSDGTPSQDIHDWNLDSTDGFPENTPLSMNGRWERLLAVGGLHNPVWIWEDTQSRCSISLRKIPPNEGESVEEVAQLYAQSHPDQPVKTNQTQLSHQAIIIQQTTQTRAIPNTFIKLFQRGPDIWMLSGSWFGKKECNWCQEMISNYAQIEHQ